ncbi:MULTISPECIES: recombinase family protein [Streptomyces]|uniref:Resolvase/invertase-type recombinase catalytic domain-containing protein n=1 Tax=Streptomyces viridochromogenes TaxID=1938 RepID=A0A0L8KIU7_STRVR|nr:MULTISPECIES: recombinase family protein [Streptomyces]KOG25669.1 hypothetical protein ADK34_17585 [Streptomyces viridochromogenes]
MNGPAGGFRHLLIGHARVSTADQNPDHQLSRSVLHLVTLGADPRERGIALHVIEQGIDTSTMGGRALFGMLSVRAELHRPAAAGP